MVFFFWSILAIILYTYVGYAMLLLILIKAKRYYTNSLGRKNIIEQSLPTCALVIAAYNEEYIIHQKITNTLSLKYPDRKLKIYIVADGSTDNTVRHIEEYPQIRLLYQPIRKGKVAAINRAMKIIDSEIVVFTDANTFLNEDALVNLAYHFSDNQVGGVAGEKRIYIPEKAEASSAGEGLYWKYESKLKQWDSELFSTIGAAGELFSIRRKLYEEVPQNTILDDFVISMRIAQKGYKITYEPNAYAVESSSLNVHEELKRKIRIAAGGIQSILALRSMLNPIKYPMLSFQFISHRVLRWTITPFLLILLFFINLMLLRITSVWIYQYLFIIQVLFYGLATLGLGFEKRKLKIKIAFVPYYFCVMNYAILAGIVKFSRNQQNSLWEKVIRKEKEKILYKR